MNQLEAEARLCAAPSQGLRGHIVVPGDKSISHRALILGALAGGETRVEGLLEARDVLATAAALRAFGARIARSPDGLWRIRGGAWVSPRSPIDCGNSGTAARLLMGAAAGFPIRTTFTGDRSLSSRPMRRVIEPLVRMGARTDGGETLPITLQGGGLAGIRHLNDNSSAQVKSAILLAGLRANGPVEVIEPAPSRDHTENMLRAFGCEIEVEPFAAGRRIRLGLRRNLASTDVRVPADPSSAAFPLVAALISPGSQVIAHGVLINPLRAGLFATLVEMGAHLTIANHRMVSGERVADIIAESSALRGVTVPSARAPSMIDEYPILAVAAAFAAGETVMHGLGELRLKECDRLEAILTGLDACGVEAEADGDTLRVRGRAGPPAGGAIVPSCGDHRIAMSFLVLGIGARNPVTIDQAEMIATSFPGFVALMRSLGGEMTGARP
jgi:3-phosphoshikimate 1-carboxyvinyltransferase